MKKLGLKRCLLLSVMVLVGLSVSVSNTLSYINTEKTITKLITQSSETYVANKAQAIEKLISEKEIGLKKMGEYFKNKEFPGTTNEDFIALTEVIAKATNTGSSFIGFESNGLGVWNLSDTEWINHILKGDVREQSYYQEGRLAKVPTVTDPYPGDGGIYWISFVQKTLSGVLGVDMELGFLNELVSNTTEIPGSVAIILNQDSTIMATSSKAIENGELATNYEWFKPAVLKAVSNEKAIAEYNLEGEENILLSHRIKVADKNWYFAIGLSKSVIYSELTTARRSAIISTLVTTFISVLITYFLIQILYRPILTLKNTIDGLSSGNGDLTQRIIVESNDELGQIATGVNQFIENLQNIMLDIQSATNALNQNSAQLKEQSVTNSNMLQSHLGETEQVVTAIEEMNSTASAMAQDVAHTANLTQQASDHSQASHLVIDQSQQTFSALISDVEQSTIDAEKMTERTKGINNVLSVIGAIAEQTNLLALNAAIEAARAGEQGRGFAVVADEVRNLASRTKDSTEEIEVALTELLSVNQVVVKSMNQTKERCLSTADDAGKVTQSLEMMADFVDEINKLNIQIAAATEEQSSVTHEVSRNMTSINDIVVELGGNGQKALQEAEAIGEVNDQLVAIVNRFKL